MLKPVAERSECLHQTLLGGICAPPDTHWEYLVNAAHDIPLLLAVITPSVKEARDTVFALFNTVIQIIPWGYF